MANEVNREYKSSLFAYMLSHKEYALQVYNVLNNSDYTNPDDIEITTLENVVFINIKNDVSFILDNIFSLYEHQSTYNPNMPIRSLFYIADSYERIIKNNELNIYGSRLVKIPTPKCVVFYNGEQEYPDKMILKLSDAFENKNSEGDIEVQVTMLNINYFHNKKLLDNCEVLRGYSLYNEKFKEYNKLERMSKTEAALKAIDYCIKHNVLADFFKKRRNEVVGMILEYTAKQAEKDIAALESEIVAKEQKLTETKEQLEAKEQKLTETKEQLEAKEQKLTETQAQLEEKEKRIADLEQKVAFLMDEVSKLKG